MDLKWSGYDLNELLSQLLLSGTEEGHEKALVSVAGVPVENRAEYLPNAFFLKPPYATMFFVLDFIVH
jgi:hypothetical protein